MKIIKNKRDWADYTLLFFDKESPYTLIHSPEFPAEYPCGVFTHKVFSGTLKLKIIHQFIYRADAEKLIKS